MTQPWPTKSLDEICNIARGGSPRPIKQYLTDSEDGVNWIKIGDATASSKYIYRTKQRIRREGIRRSRLVHPGDFLLSNSMSFGRPYIMRTEGCIHDGWLVLGDISEKVDQDFLYLFLGSPAAYFQFDQRAAGSTVRNLNIDLVRSVKLPLPPLAEQKRIVATLDEAFAGIETAIANTEKNLANARELFEAHLNATFDVSHPDWQSTTLGELYRIGSSKRVHKKDWRDCGVPFYRAREIVKLAENGAVDNELFISEELFDQYGKKTGVPQAGDLMVTAVGTLGICYVVQPADSFYFKDASVLWFRPKAPINAKFIQYAFRSPVIIGQTTDSQGATVGTLTISRAKSILISVPEMKVQDEIARDLEELESGVLKLSAMQQRKLDALAELKQSLLQKAFSGKLTAGRAEREVESAAV